MTIHQSAYDESQGSPNLQALQDIQEAIGGQGLTSFARTAYTPVLSGSGGVEVDIPTGARIIDAHVICTNTNGGGTMTIKTGATVPVTISDAMTCAVNDTIARASTIDWTYGVVGADGIKIFANSDDDSGDVYITYVKT